MKNNPMAQAEKLMEIGTPVLMLKDNGHNYCAFERGTYQGPYGIYHIVRIANNDWLVWADDFKKL